MEAIEKLFRCFEFRELHSSVVSKHWASVRVIIGNINVAKIKIPTTKEMNEFVEAPAYAMIIVRQERDGTLSVSGSYHAL